MLCLRLFPLLVSSAFAASANPQKASQKPQLSTPQADYLNAAASSFNNAAPDCSVPCFTTVIPTKDPLAYMSTLCADPDAFRTNLILCIQGNWRNETLSVDGCVETEDYDAVYSVLDGLPPLCARLQTLFESNQTSLEAFDYATSNRSGGDSAESATAATGTASARVQPLETGGDALTSPVFPTIDGHGGANSGTTSMACMSVVLVAIVFLFGHA
ncbi:hypothetical protein HDU81_008746 [Chytriomyces hyalinus]|nr:hypothetical protein HDU81_008746 [Chytriomyces hyalinus]